MANAFQTNLSVETCEMNSQSHSITNSARCIGEAPPGWQCEDIVVLSFILHHLLVFIEDVTLEVHEDFPESIWNSQLVR